MWDRVLPYLSADHELLIPTLPGHAGGPPLGDDLVGQLAEGLDEPVHIVGNSLPVKPRSQSHQQSVDALVKSLSSGGLLATSARVPGTVAALEIAADLRSRQVHTSVTFDAPREGVRRCG